MPARILTTLLALLIEASVVEGPGKQIANRPDRLEILLIGSMGSKRKSRTVFSETPPKYPIRLEWY